MLSKEELRGILSDQRESFERDEQTIERDINLEQYIKIDPIVIISGVRRCGKSTLLKINQG